MANKTCLIVASGPSLTKKDLLASKGLFDCTIVINTSYQICDWADILYACDNKWWKYHSPLLNNFQGRKITPFAHSSKEFQLEHKIADIGIFFDDRIAFGNNSGHQAITLAILEGFSQIYLLGYDCKYSGTLSHWFGDHPDQLKVWQPFEKWISDFKSLNDIISAKGINVINLSRDTDITAFTRMDFDECILNMKK